MIAGSLFSGVAGLDLGLSRAGFEHAFFAELDPWRRDVISAHYHGVLVYDDVRSVAQPLPAGIEQPERVDLLCGGFPCQDLSVAGKRAGLDGARSGLFFEFARIIDAIRPAWLLLENVPGLLSSNDGRDFGVVLGTLAELGYGVAWRVLDARYFGVPQRRRRVFIVGHSGGDDAKAIRALCESCDGHPAPRDCTWQRTTSRPTDGPLNARVVNALDRQRGGPDDNSAQAGHLVTSFHPTQDPITEAEMSPAIGRKTGGMNVQSANVVVRRLTPVECERLMSWPDAWTAPEGVKAPDSRRYAACGDGVVSNVSEWIGRRIIALSDG